MRQLPSSLSRLHCERQLLELDADVSWRTARDLPAQRQEPHRPVHDVGSTGWHHREPTLRPDTAFVLRRKRSRWLAVAVLAGSEPGRPDAYRGVLLPEGQP